jgi:SAM-dependent methyltransferase
MSMYTSVYRCCNIHSPLYFLHIPKTAGTSFIAILEEHFSDSEICPAQLWHDLLAIPYSRLEGYRLFRGHFYAYLEDYLPQKPVLLTMLRDPLERSLSHFDHIRNEPGHYLYHKAQSHGNITEALQDPDMRAMIANFQTRSLALRLDPVAISTGLDQEQLEGLELERRLETDIASDVTDDELLRRAKACLDRCLFVGIVEQFDDSVSMLNQLFGWTQSHSTKALNVRPNRLRREDLPQEAEELIRSYTQLDMELYRYAEQLFEHRRYQMEADMTTERVVEVPWALSQLPQSGVVLDVGSCDATYLGSIQQADRQLHCLDPRDCHRDIPQGAVFHHGSIIGNDLPRAYFDAVLLVSVLEHIGMPCYGQSPIPGGDHLALAECWSLLKPGGKLIVTVPAGQGKVVSWYRQYSPAAIHRLFRGWHVEFSYWGFDGHHYVPVDERDVEQYDYREYYRVGAGAGAVACIVAFRHREG